MKLTRFLLAAMAVLPLAGCTEILSQTESQPPQREYFIPATVERVEYEMTGTTRRIPLRECINSHCRTIRMIDEYEVMVTYYLRTESYNQLLIYRRREDVATADTGGLHQRVILKIAQYRNGTSEVTLMEPLPQK